MRFKLILFSDARKNIGTYDFETYYPDINLKDSIDLSHLSEMLSASLANEMDQAVGRLLYLDKKQ